jgi:hypothetical protein
VVGIGRDVPRDGLDGGLAMLFPSPRQGNGWPFLLAATEPERGGCQELAPRTAQRPKALDGLSRDEATSHDLGNLLYHQHQRLRGHRPGVVSPWDRLRRLDAHSPSSRRNSTGNRIFTP